MIAIRLGTHHKDPAQAKALLDMLRRYPGCCDEVWLCSEYGFPPLETHVAAAEQWETVAEMFRREGIRVSLQISNTVGHGAYMRGLDNRGLLEERSVRRMVGANGETANYCFCWADKAFQDYCVRMVKAYASKTKPYCVWVDDDLRADNHYPADYGCFCDDCVARFSAEQGQSYTRKALVAAMNADADVRKAFVAFTKRNLAAFAGLLTEAIHEVSPESVLGYQYAQINGYDGDDRKYIFDAMHLPGKPPKSRPGGGVYTDHRPAELIEKQFLVGYSNYRLPSYVTEIRPEVENTPDVPYGKTVYGTCLEAALYFAGGANCISFATLMTEYESLYYHARFLEAFAQARPYWEKLAEENENTRPAGVSPALPKEGYLRSSFGGGSLPWAEHTWKRAALGGFYDGFPMCYDDNAPLLILTAENVSGMTEKERKALAFRPVITDTEGFMAYCKAEGLENVRFARAKGPCWEAFLAGEDKGAGWTVTVFHEGSGPLVMTRLPEGSEVLSRFDGLPFDGEVGIASALVPMSGARWAVIGCGLFDRVVSSAKRRQIWAAAEAVSPGAFPAKIEQPAQVGLFARRNERGRVTSVSVLHYGLGPSETPLTLRIYRPEGFVAKAWSNTRQDIRLLSSRSGDSLLVTLPKLHGWDMLTVFLEH